MVYCANKSRGQDEEIPDEKFHSEGQGWSAKKRRVEKLAELLKSSQTFNLKSPYFLFFFMNLKGDYYC